MDRRGKEPHAESSQPADLSPRQSAFLALVLLGVAVLIGLFEGDSEWAYRALVLGVLFAAEVAALFSLFQIVVNLRQTRKAPTNDLLRFIAFATITIGMLLTFEAVTNRIVLGIATVTLTTWGTVYAFRNR